MDRLVCGDVGFGKTEVAVRAVFKAVQDGTQAAVLAPDDAAGQPARPDLRRPLRALSGAGRAAQPLPLAGAAAAVVEGLADGSVDVVIGTHRLLAQDVQFKQLGLLVVDEEQRFGVTHKEAVKRMAEGVDVLTLTASPIPRTLEMALTGIRDLSMVNTPPADRRPILTYVGRAGSLGGERGAAAGAAARGPGLLRAQPGLGHRARWPATCATSCPRPGWPIAHGQMDEGSLETVVLDFWERRYDVLVCTTIIESGIDMPSVNTLIVDRADLLGLGQLHQIRGRVGRGGQRAYAYLFHPADRVLSEQAYERLRTIGEHTELGSGFKIAMRDLEIRGAGNLLGLGPVRAHRRGRLRPLRPAGGRGGGRGQGRGPAGAADGLHRRPGGRPPAQGLRGGRGRPARGLPPPGGGDAGGGRRRHRRRVGRPLRPAARPGRGPPGAGPAAGQRHGPGDRRDRHELGPPRRDAASPVVRLSPVALPASAQVRLRRLAPGATYREDLAQLLVPMTTGAAGRRHGARRHRGPDPAARCGTAPGTPCSMRGA